MYVCVCLCVCVLDGWLGRGASRALSEAPLMWKIITCVVRIISKKSRIKVNRLTAASAAAPDEPPAARRTPRGSPRRRQCVRLAGDTFRVLALLKWRSGGFAHQRVFTGLRECCRVCEGSRMKAFVSPENVTGERGDYLIRARGEQLELR